jgi:hypothetical protein
MQNEHEKRRVVLLRDAWLRDAWWRGAWLRLYKKVKTLEKIRLRRAFLCAFFVSFLLE